MGCVSSSSKPEKAPPEPVPDVNAIQNTPAPKVHGEPLLLPDGRMTDPDHPTTFHMKQVAKGGTGATFEIAKTDSETVDDYKLEPAFGFGGQVVRRQLQDLLKLTVKDEATPLCYCIKSAEQGDNIFKILVDTPVRDTQPPSIFKGPNETKLYIYASVEFDYHTRVGGIWLHGQSKTQRPLYKIRQCNAEVWVVKKNEVAMCQVQQVKGLMPNFSSYEVTVSPNVDLAFAICLTNICDWFRMVCKTRTITYYG